MIVYSLKKIVNITMTNSIKSIDDQTPTKEDIKDIKKGNCLNCYKHYKEEGGKISFARLSNGELLWWHEKNPNRASCKNRKKLSTCEYNKY